MYKGWSETAHSLGTPKKRVFKQSAGKSKENERGVSQTWMSNSLSDWILCGPCELWKYTSAMRAMWYARTCNSWVEGVNVKVGTYTLCSSSVPCRPSVNQAVECPTFQCSNIVSKIGGCMSVKRKAWTNLWLCNFILHIPCSKQPAAHTKTWTIKVG